MNTPLLMFETDGDTHQKALLVFFFDFLFDRHVFEFAGFEDVTAFLTFDVLRILVAGDDLHARVLAQVRADFLLRGLRRALRHKLRGVFILQNRVMGSENAGILSRL